MLFRLIEMIVAVATLLAYIHGQNKPQVEFIPIRIEPTISPSKPEELKPTAVEPKFIEKAKPVEKPKKVNKSKPVEEFTPRENELLDKIAALTPQEETPVTMHRDRKHTLLQTGAVIRYLEKQKKYDVLLYVGNMPIVTGIGDRTHYSEAKREFLLALVGAVGPGFKNATHKLYDSLYFPIDKETIFDAEEKAKGREEYLSKIAKELGLINVVFLGDNRPVSYSYLGLRGNIVRYNKHEDGNWYGIKSPD